MSATQTREDKIAADQAAMNEARAEAQDGRERMPPPHQLSFATGQRGEPDFASVKISGSLPVGRDLYKQQGFMVRISTLRGEVVAEGVAACTNLAFPDKTDKDGVTTTERVHTLSFEKREV